MNAKWEYFCFNCGQLRLYLTVFEVYDKPTKCRNCGSYNIKVGEINTLNKEELKKERLNATYS
jgi:DNA-directed RNA polymerase subunit RPC12/RpoP